MPDVHLHPNRGWALIRDRGKLSPEETEHLRTCLSCNFWLAKFSSLARKAGFPITFEIPALEKKAGSDNEGE
jgi:hypothetical protein